MGRLSCTKNTTREHVYVALRQLIATVSADHAKSLGLSVGQLGNIKEQHKQLEDESSLRKQAEIGMTDIFPDDIGDPTITCQLEGLSSIQQYFQPSFSHWKAVNLHSGMITDAIGNYPGTKIVQTNEGDEDSERNYKMETHGGTKAYVQRLWMSVARLHVAMTTK